MRALLIALCLALAMPAAAFRPTLTAGGATAGSGGPPPSGGATLDDDFEADATGWSRLGGDWCRKQSGDGVLENVGPNVCIYDNSTGNAGTVPTTDEHWIVAEYAVAYANTGFHLKNVSDGTGNSIGVVWNTSGTIRIGTCDTGSTCAFVDHASIGPATPADGDQFAVMVGGSGSSAETCVWTWAAADTDPSDWSDPTTWGDADACQVAGGTITVLAAYSDCGGATDCFNESMDFVPTDGQTYVGFLSQTTDNVEWEWVLAGDNP